MHLTIYKTSVSTKQEATALQPLLRALPVIRECNFDLDDCDNILRIVSTELKTQLVCQLLSKQGYSCEEMESFAYTL